MFMPWYKMISHLTPQSTDLGCLIPEHLHVVLVYFPIFAPFWFQRWLVALVCDPCRGSAV